MNWGCFGANSLILTVSASDDSRRRKGLLEGFRPVERSDRFRPSDPCCSLLSRDLGLFRTSIGNDLPTDFDLVGLGDFLLSDLDLEKNPDFLVD